MAAENGWGVYGKTIVIPEAEHVINGSPFNIVVKYSKEYEFSVSGICLNEGIRINYVYSSVETKPGAKLLVFGLI